MNDGNDFPEVVNFQVPDFNALADNYAKTAETILSSPKLTREGKLNGVAMLFLESFMAKPITYTHELLVVWEAVRNTDGDGNFGTLQRGETVIASMPYWQAVALAREHNKTLAALTA